MTSGLRKLLDRGSPVHVLSKPTFGVRELAAVIVRACLARS
jgi:hypothetical protein